MPESEPERDDLFGMGGQQFGHGYQRVHSGDDSLGYMVHGIDLYRPFKAPHHLIGVELRGVDVHRSYGAHFGQQRQRRRNDVGNIAIPGPVEVLGMILDVDEPQVCGTDPADVAQAHGLIEIVEIATVQMFGGHSEGFDVKLVALSKLFDETGIVGHNNGLLNSVTVTFCLCSVTDGNDFAAVEAQYTFNTVQRYLN